MPRDTTKPTTAGVTSSAVRAESRKGIVSVGTTALRGGETITGARPPLEIAVPGGGGGRRAATQVVPGWEVGWTLLLKVSHQAETRQVAVGRFACAGPHVNRHPYA